MVEGSRDSRAPTMLAGAGQPSGELPETEPSRGDSNRDPAVEAARIRVLHRLVGDDDEPEQAPRIGRFTVLSRVGQGGMGVVYAAFDPQLDRRVAIKVLTPGVASRVRPRVVREAQAMARLNHPNVAHVYEVGEHAGGTFIAMEFVSGRTLRRWQRTPHEWPEIVEVYRQAACGLAAAHAAGLVHRDFKPDNAIVGDDGRVRVLDFGLARGVLEPSDHAIAPRAAARTNELLASPLTESGTLAGTPAYMAPEQFLGDEVTARSDQFAWCVALWEALYGERPFAGKTTGELAANVTAGRIREPTRGGAPTRANVPTWIRRVLERGLSLAPADRFATTDALLEALARDPTRRRRRAAQTVAAAIAVAAIAGGGWAVQRARHQAAIADCEAEGAAISEVWGTTTRADVAAAIAATGVSHAAATFERLDARLGSYATEWAEARANACVAADVDHTWSAGIGDRARWCLDDGRGALSALVELLEDADADLAHAALSAAFTLPSVAPCVDDSALARRDDPPPLEQRAAIDDVRVDLARVSALLHAERDREALVVAERAAEAASATGWPKIQSATLRTKGSILAERDPRSEDAREMMEQAYAIAARAEAWDEAARAADRLARAASWATHIAEADQWSMHAEIATALAHDPTGALSLANRQSASSIARLRGDLDRAIELAEQAVLEQARIVGDAHPNTVHGRTILGNALLAAGRWQDARAEFERGLAIVERELGPDHPAASEVVRALASVEMLHGDSERALELAERALAIRHAAYGPRSAKLAFVLSTLGSVYAKRGDYERALEYYQHGLELQEAAFEPDHAEIAGSLNNIGLVRLEMGDDAGSLDYHQRALAMRERTFGPDHPDVARSLNNVGNALGNLDRRREAAVAHERALAIRERIFGEDHPETGRSASNLGKVLAELGDTARGWPLLERALAIREKALGPEHIDVAQTLHAMTLIASNDRDWPRARELGRRALAVREKAHAPATQIATSRLRLAIALCADEPRCGEHRAEALELGAKARDAMRGHESDNRALVAEIDAWLAAHPGRP